MVPHIEGVQEPVQPEVQTRPGRVHPPETRDPGPDCIHIPGKGLLFSSQTVWLGPAFGICE